MTALTQGAALAPGRPLTAAEAEQTRLAFVAAMDAAGTGWPGLDLGDVDAIDTAGVQLLLSLQRSLAERGLPWSVTRSSPAVRDVLALYGLGHLLDGVKE